VDNFPNWQQKYDRKLTKEQRPEIFFKPLPDCISADFTDIFICIQN
jgi:hypothetical protein